MNDAAASAARDRVQVLIVDDSEDAAISLSMLLELEDISCAMAHDAETALRLVERTVPTVLLIDIGLPGMNGYDLAQRLRGLPQLSASTLIALTGREGQQGEEKTLFNQFWTKPFDPKRLLQEVKNLLIRPHSSA